jgi:hypothetical protein
MIYIKNKYWNRLHTYLDSRLKLTKIEPDIWKLSLTKLAHSLALRLNYFIMCINMQPCEAHILLSIANNNSSFASLFKLPA